MGINPGYFTGRSLIGTGIFVAVDCVSRTAAFLDRLFRAAPAPNVDIRTPPLFIPETDRGHDLQVPSGAHALILFIASDFGKGLIPPPGVPTVDLIRGELEDLKTERENMKNGRPATQ